MSTIADLRELTFPVIGQNLSIDHGYELYSALAHKRSQIHDWQDTSGRWRKYVYHLYNLEK